MNEIMAVLSPVLGDKLAAAIVEHRKAKKPAFTLYAAELQVREYIKTGDPVAAAEMQILRGWTAIKASWYFKEIEKDNRHGNARRTIADAAMDFIGIENHSDDAFRIPGISKH